MKLPEDKYLDKLAPEIFSAGFGTKENFFPSWQEGRRWFNLVLNQLCRVFHTNPVAIQTQKVEAKFAFAGASPEYDYLLKLHGGPSGIQSCDICVESATGQIVFSISMSYPADPDFLANPKTEVSQETVIQLQNFMHAILNKNISVF